MFGLMPNGGNASLRLGRGGIPPPNPLLPPRPRSDCPFFSAELEAVFRKAKCAAKKDVALAPTHPCAGNDKELPKNFDKYMIKNYSIQQSIAFLTNSPSFPINPFFSVSFLFIALSSIFLISPTLSSFILRPQNSE